MGWLGRDWRDGLDGSDGMVGMGWEGAGWDGRGGMEWEGRGAAGRAEEKILELQKSGEEDQGETRLEFGALLRSCPSRLSFTERAMRLSDVNHVDPPKSRETGKKVFGKNRRSERRGQD